MKLFKRAGALILSAALAVSLGLTVLPVTAGAAYESSGDGDINVRLHFHPGGTDYSTDVNGDGIQRYGFRLYRIATIDEDGKGFTLTEEYEDLVGTRIPTTMTPYNAYENINWELIKRTGTYINENSPEPSFAAPLVDGEAVFTDLPAGLYLGSGPRVVVDGRTYTPTPFIVCLPYMIGSPDDVPEGSPLEAGVFYSDVGVTVKFTYTEPGGGGGSSSNPPNNPPPTNPPSDNPPPTNPPPTNPPSDNPPSDNPPSDNPPSENPPSENPPSENPPTETIEDVPLANLPDEPSPTAVLPDMPVPQAQLPSTPPSPTAVLSDKPKLPQTGALWWPVPLMGGSGGLMLCAGLLGRRKNK